jgi:hypothetical protein
LSHGEPGDEFCGEVDEVVTLQAGELLRARGSELDGGAELRGEPVAGRGEFLGAQLDDLGVVEFAGVPLDGLEPVALDLGEHPGDPFRDGGVALGFGGVDGRGLEEREPVGVVRHETRAELHADDPARATRQGQGQMIHDHP